MINPDTDHGAGACGEYEPEAEELSDRGEEDEAMLECSTNHHLTWGWDRRKSAPRPQGSLVHKQISPWREAF